MADLMLADRPLGGAARGHARPHHGRGLHHGGGGNAGVSNGSDHGARLHRAQKAAKKQRLALDMVIHHDEQISMLRDLPEGHRLGVWLKVDSGMHRLGFAPQRVRGARHPVLVNGKNRLDRQSLDGHAECGFTSRSGRARGGSGAALGCGIARGGSRALGRHHSLRDSCAAWAAGRGFSIQVRTKFAYQCQGCGALAPKWSGQCGDCGAWNTLVEIAYSGRPGAAENRPGDVSAEPPRACMLEAISLAEEAGIPSGVGEVDRVLGGGIVAGAVVLIGGDPASGNPPCCCRCWPRRRARLSVPACM